MSFDRNIDVDRVTTLAVLEGRHPIDDGRSNWLGHQLVDVDGKDRGAAQIDAMLLNGATEHEMLARIAAVRSDVRNHLRHLREDHGLPLQQLGDVWTFDRTELDLVIRGSQRGGLENAHASPRFVKGRVYNRRSDIHAKFGGQRQGGISTPRGVDCLFLFTGAAGEQHGYTDGWTTDGVFVFYGEGQHGDMGFIKGNLAIRDHVANHKGLHLFQSLNKEGLYRYIGEFICASTEFRDGRDTDGNTRRSIAFHLLPVEATGASDDSVQSDEDLSALRKRAIEAASSAPAASVVDAVRVVRERSAIVKRYVLRRANGICESCGQLAPFQRHNGQPYLEPHHTQRLADDGPDHPLFVGAICPNCHREIHYGANGRQKNQQLQEHLAEIEKP